MYCLKYIIQSKQQSTDEGLEKTRAQFSKGLGLGYLTTNVYYWHTEDYENPILYSFVDGNKVALPRYYKNKIFTKWQMREACLDTWERSMTERAKDIRKHMHLFGGGVIKTRQYLQALRVDQANALIRKSKFNESL